MHIDQYRLESGEYKRPEDSYAYEDAVSFIVSGVLGFCGCGRPEDALVFLRDVLRHIQLLKAVDFSPDTPPGELSFQEWQERGRQIGSDGALYFAYYVLDKKGLTEHGGSVPGWLTPAGKELLQDLEELLVDTPASRG